MLRPQGEKQLKGILGQRHQKDNGLPTKIDSECGLEGYSHLKDGLIFQGLSTQSCQSPRSVTVRVVNPKPQPVAQICTLRYQTWDMTSTATPEMGFMGFTR